MGDVVQSMFGAVSSLACPLLWDYKHESIHNKQTRLFVLLYLFYKH